MAATDGPPDHYSTVSDLFATDCPPCNYGTAQLQGNERSRVSRGLHASDTRVSSE